MSRPRFDLFHITPGENMNDMNRRMAAAIAAATMTTSGAAVADGNWTSAGHDIQNTRYQSSESKIGVDTVATLSVKWAFTTEGDVSATPAVDGARVYFPDWAGNLYAVDRKTGQQVWQARIPAATGIPGDKARATPAISGNRLLVGTQGPFGGGGKMLAFDKNTGALLWATQLESHFGAIVTQSATVHDGRVYVGVASLEEALAGLIPGYPCCSFRGSMLALDVETGAILWKTYMAPAEPAGYSGNAIWGSAPAVDTKRGQVYVATGNNYSVPESVETCVAAAGADTTKVRACMASDNSFDSIVALDLQSGAVRWATRALPADTWIAACIGFSVPGGAPCPPNAGPDHDFGQAPALFKVRTDGQVKPRELVGAGQKSGKYWALDPDTGAVIWTTQAGPGGTGGGLQWGSAVDGQRVYTANANSDRNPWTLPNGSVTQTGVWSGLDAATGQVLWQTIPPNGGSTSGPATTANGVMFGCSLDPSGYMYALDGATGAVLWQFASGGSCLSGAAISNGEVYWGSGYSNFGGAFGGPNNKLYAFRLP
jgi:polyvinyl alcohol dehydrogenase (cytochrome)